MVQVERDNASACSAALHALELAEPFENDSILIYASADNGLLLVREALEMNLRCIYCDEDPIRRALAETAGATAFDRQTLGAALPDLTDGEGPNIIVDACDVCGILGDAVRQASQAGRIVVCGDKKGFDTYPMRTMSIKEGTILGTHL